MALQNPELSFSDAQFLLNSIIDAHKAVRFKTANDKYLVVDATIVHSVPFHTGMLKVLEGHEDQLSALEKNVLLKFKKPVQNVPEINQNVNADWASSLLSKRKVSENSKSSYFSMKFIRPTSCDVERLFSVSRNILSYERQSMTPERFEHVIFLKMNKRLWDAGVISRLMVGSDEPDDDSNPEHLNLEEELVGNYRNASAVESDSLIVEREDPDPEMKHQDLDSLDVQEHSEEISIANDSVICVSTSESCTTATESEIQNLRRNQEIHPFERSVSFDVRMQAEVARDPRFNVAQLIPKHNVRESRPPEKYAVLKRNIALIERKN